MSGLKHHDVLTDTTAAMQTHLGELTKPVREHSIGIGFADHTLRRLVRSLRVKIAEEGFDLADIAETGLGYANLLFIATVILELQNATESELTIFLVEEPEAHLHPQLQTVLLEYLKDQAELSATNDHAGPAGRIQIIATTHSPTLASAVGVNDIVVLRTARLQELAPADPEQKPQVRRVTRAIPIASLGLDEDETRKINQYLDVTKSALLFARRVLLVEGLAEAVIIPALARDVVFASGTKDYVERRRSFRGVTVIAVGSVDFIPYIKLLLTAARGFSIVDKLIVITDLDPDLQPLPGETPKQQRTVNRIGNLENAAASVGAGNRLIIKAASYTLEADLLGAGAENETVLRAAYLKQHSRSLDKWLEIVGSSDSKVALYRKLRSDKNFISKGEFAHDVATAIQHGTAFTCPNYLNDAFVAALSLSGEGDDAAK